MRSLAARLGKGLDNVPLQALIEKTKTYPVPEKKLAAVLKGKTMSVTDLAEAVQRAGYQTTSKTFRTIVNQALIKHSDTFKKISRGMYTV
jgi:hypothetical protein